MQILNVYKAHRGKVQYVAGLSVGAMLGGFVVWASNHGANAGHLVTFLGGLVGTGLAVTAAIRIETWKRDLDRREKFNNVIKYLDKLKANLLLINERDVEPDDDVEAMISLTLDYMGAFIEWSDEVLKKDITDFDSMRHLFWSRKTGKSVIVQFEKYEARLSKGEDPSDIYREFSQFCLTPTHSLGMLIKALKAAGRL